MLNSISSNNNFFESNTDYQTSQAQASVDTSVFDEQISAAETEKSQAQTDATTINEELSAQQDAQTALETSMNQLTNVISEADTMISAFDSQIGQLQSSIGSLQGQLSSLVDEKVQTGTDEKGNPKFETISHEAERQQIQQQINEQQQQLAEAEQSKQATEQLKQETETEYQNLQTQIEESNMNIEGLDNNAQEAQTVVEEKETELNELKEEKEQYVAQEQEKIQQEQEKNAENTENTENTPTAEELSGFGDENTIKSADEASFTDGREETSGENTIKDIGMNNFVELYNDMGVMLYQGNYTEDQQKAAKENLEKIVNSKVDENDETAKRYQQLAKEVLQNSTEVSEQTTELETEMTDATQNYGGGSDQVKDVKEKENTLLKEYQDKALDIAIDICVKEGAAKEPLEAVKTALNELGAYKETRGDNIGDDVQRYGAQEGEAWCMYFMNYVYNNVFKDVFSQQASYAYNNAGDMESAAKALGVYAENDGSYSPCAGDVFNIGNAHVGMFLAEDDNYYYTIEGNADDEVKFRKYAKPGTSDYETGDKRYDDITGFAKMNEYYGGTSKPVFPNIYPEYRFELATKNGSVT